jgi:hypothetical protein
MRVDTPRGAFRNAFSLDGIGRETQLFGGSPRTVPAQRHARVHSYPVGRDLIKNHFSSRDLQSLTLSGGSKIRV